MTPQEDFTLPFYEQVLDFLASGPSARQIVNYRPPDGVQRRFSELLEANRQRALTLQEEEELDHNIRMDRMLSLLKVKAAGRRWSWQNG